MQQGRYVANVIRRRLRGEDSPPFRYMDKGTLATIGRNHAVGVFGKLHLHGVVAWLLWLLRASAVPGRHAEPHPGGHPVGVPLLHLQPQRQVDTGEARAGVARGEDPGAA